MSATVATKETKENNFDEPQIRSEAGAILYGYVTRSLNSAEIDRPFLILSSFCFVVSQPSLLSVVLSLGVSIHYLKQRITVNGISHLP